jgi:hypothetical protein
MSTLTRTLRALMLVFVTTGSSHAADRLSEPRGLSDDNETLRRQLQARYNGLAQDLGRICPEGSAADQAAFDRCRQSLYGDSLLRRSLPTILLWGRARGQPLKDTPLTQFAPDVFAGLYAPLFMFSGTATVHYDSDERRYVATLPARFRNRLPPGQFPYPFWHDAAKWSGYQATIALRFYLDGDSGQIRVGQFVPGTIGDELAADSQRRAAAFDGRWLWTDEHGHTQPQVTLFDGLYRPDNPYLAGIDSSYRALALELRVGECSSCHTPDNPRHARRIVLLQTPAHAAGEIKRILRAVRHDDMPEDELGFEKPLAADAKARLLDRATAFDTALTAARDWETRHSPSDR